MANDLEKISESWSQAFNALPYETRTIGIALEIRTRLQHLDFERRRLKAAYRLSLSKIRDHEKNLESALRILGYAPAQKEQTTPSAESGNG